MPERPLSLFGRILPDAGLRDERPTWQQASEEWIRRALEHSQRLPSGGWYVLDASRTIRPAPKRIRVKDRALVVWRDGEGVCAAPDACPHLGASLAEGCVRGGRLVCPWHGLTLGREGLGDWRPLPAHDDGVLCWVRLDDDPHRTDAPILPTRPRDPIDAVIRVEVACDPCDVIANRLDPWHGAHFHPYSFGRLQIIDQQPEEITVRVAYRVLGPYAVEVDARFHCADPRTIVMTVVRGEGEGSVVETHATPIEPGRTAVVEATLATSDRPGFAIARHAATIVRPLVRWAARRLWVDDAAYAERLHVLRRGRRDP